MGRVIIVITICFLSALLYRLGGIGKPWTTFKARDAGCSLCAVGIMLALGVQVYWWVHLLSFGLMWAALSTYTYGIPKPNGNVQWYHWLLHGIMVQFSGLLYVIFLKSSLGWFAVGVGMSGLLVVAWSQLMDDVNWEEGGRGFIVAFMKWWLVIQAVV